MQFYSAVSDNESTDAAAEHVIRDTREALGDKIDVVFAFFTAHHREEASALLERLWLELDPKTIVGCSAEGVIGGHVEVERAPGISLLAGQMPGVGIHPFHIDEPEWKELLTHPEDLAGRLGYDAQTRALIGFGDPFSTPMTQLLPILDGACPDAPLIGGMASAAQSPGQNILLHNDSTHEAGMVGVSLSGPIAVETIVSQGCRPIGTPMVITKGQQNVIAELGGRQALKALRDMISALPEADQELLANGLLVGRAISEYRDTFGRNDFLVRNIIGANEEAGAIAIGDYVRVGQTVQFFARDAETANEDLTLMLERQSAGASASGALLFSCNGRGMRLFNRANHDISTAASAMPQTPIAGFFAAGELGPVGGHNFIHGQTASFALFRPM